MPGEYSGSIYDSPADLALADLSIARKQVDVARRALRQILETRPTAYSADVREIEKQADTCFNCQSIRDSNPGSFCEEHTRTLMCGYLAAKAHSEAVHTLKKIADEALLEIA